MSSRRLVTICVWLGVLVSAAAPARAAEREVSRDALAEQERLLPGHGELRTQSLTIDTAHVDAVELDRAGVVIVQPQ